VASRHGSTRDIARAIADQLRAARFTVDLRDVSAVRDIDGYDAVILGSAVYMGNWLPEARAFVDVHHEQLTHVPTWLFSSGPLGRENPLPAGDPNCLTELMQMTGARDHQTFAGKLDRANLRFVERFAAKMVKAPEGDFRDWGTIRLWARAIARALQDQAEPAA
jgi:menaquinone-dependent protoporphyrinogen oxidase